MRVTPNSKRPVFELANPLTNNTTAANAKINCIGQTRTGKPAPVNVRLRTGYVMTNTPMGIATAKLERRQIRSCVMPNAARSEGSIAPITTNGRELYRVRVGPTRDRASAEALAAQLKRMGQSGSIVPIS